MTPLEIFEYKRKWMLESNGNPVRIHSDKRQEAKDWCKQNLSSYQWNISEFSDVYEDTFFFELSEESDLFSEEFRDWTYA